MKKIIATVVASLALAGAASPQAQAQAPAPSSPTSSTAPAAPLDPAAVAAAHELFDSMNYRSMMAGAMQQMTQNLGGPMRAGAEAAIKNNAKMGDQEKQAALIKLDVELPAAIAKMQALLNDPTLIDDILAETVPLYAGTYTAAELKQITAFYRSPVGVKMLASMPKLMGEGMKLGQQIVARRINAMMQQQQQEQQKQQKQQEQQQQQSGAKAPDGK